MRFDIVTLFPEMIEQSARYGVTGRAIEEHQVQLQTWNPRDFTSNTHRTVDDRPYGGGPGMVMKVEPLRDSIRAARQAEKDTAQVIYLSPQGQPLNQDAIKRFAQHSRLILIAGRYEGIDERLIDSQIDEEWSLGDYVISGGELAALIMIDAITRLLPGVLGDPESAQQDSFMHGLLDYPHYTRPAEIDGMKVPDVLQGGNHANIEQWRLKQALGRTWQRRPELLDSKALDDEQLKLLQEFITETEHTY